MKDKSDTYGMKIERLHPQSYEQLRQLVKLHGMPAIERALREIDVALKAKERA